MSRTLPVAPWQAEPWEWGGTGGTAAPQALLVSPQHAQLQEHWRWWRVHHAAGITNSAAASQAAANKGQDARRIGKAGAGMDVLCKHVPMPIQQQGWHGRVKSPTLQSNRRTGRKSSAAKGRLQSGQRSRER